MRHQKTLLAACAVALLGFSPLIQAAEGNWKQGRIYYRMVCTDCHSKETGSKIAPNEKTIAEWKDYFEKNVHGPQKQAVDYFVSKEFRESIKDTNRAAKKMLNVPDEQLLADVKAFVIHTAKDSDQPSGCE